MQDFTRYWQDVFGIFVAAQRRMGGLTGTQPPTPQNAIILKYPLKSMT